MNLRPQFLLAMTLAGAVATPAFPQTAAPSVGSSGSRTQSTASIPDFSGVWLHPGLGFGPPLSGPGPVRNKTRLPSGASDFNLVVGDYTNPILKSVAAQVVKKHGEISLAGLANPTPSTHCWPSGVPYIFFSLACRCYSSRTRSPSFISGIMNSVTCA